MPTTYVNSINSMPIYADRAEKDASGNTISSTYQPALPSKSGNAGKVLAVNSNADGLEWVSQGSGKTYTGEEAIYVDNVNDTVSLNLGTGGLAYDIDPDDQRTYVMIRTGYGCAVEEGTLNVLVDNTTIEVDGTSGALQVKASGLNIPTIGTTSL